MSTIFAKIKTIPIYSCQITLLLVLPFYSILKRKILNLCQPGSSYTFGLFHYSLSD